MIKKTAKEIRLRTENDTTFVQLVFMDGSAIDLKGPSSGLKHTRREDNDHVVYDCEFEGFELT